MDQTYLQVSDGLGDAALMHVTNSRSIGATTISVDTVSNIPTKFIATYGKLLPSGFINPSTAVNFYGHLSGSDLEIDGFLPGSTDAGNQVGDVVVIRPNTFWANFIAESINPTGAVIQFAGNTAPNGYLICDGSEVSRTNYANLFAAIGTAYGAGDGSSTFNVPNIKGKVVVGLDGSDTDFDTLGEVGGEKDHSLTTAELASHTHTKGTLVTNTTGAHTHAPGNGANFIYGGSQSPSIVFGGSGATLPYSNATASAGNHSHTISGSTASTGDGDAHNNLQPYVVMNYIIKT